MYRHYLLPTIGNILILMATSQAASGAPVNLVANGDFELGNVAFSSDYAYTPTENTAEAQYTVRTNPFPWNRFFVSVGDHTSGTGNMYVGNGDPAAESIIWESTSIPVEPGVDYFFEAWAMNVCCTPGYTGTNSPAVLEFSIVGSTTESLGVISTAFPAGQWQFISTTWNSGSNTTVDLRIINQNTAIGGNDFALDDIHFSTVSSVPVPAAVWLFGSGLLILFGRINFPRVNGRARDQGDRCPVVQS